MSKKEQEAREYADWLHNNLEEQLGHECAPHDMYYRRGDILQAFDVGWDEALRSILVDASKELPEYNEAVWVVNENREQFFCHRSNEEIVKTDKYGWCNYSGCDIVAWIRNITFCEILKANKDVLKRLKDK